MSGTHSSPKGSSPATAKGDILVYDGAKDVRVPVGSNDQVLTADSAQASGVKWDVGWNRLATYILVNATGGTDLTNRRLLAAGGGITVTDAGAGGNITVAVDASTISTGTLPVARGGTGVNGSTAANGSLLVGNGTGFSLATLTQGSGIAITNGVGTIAIATTGLAPADAQYLALAANATLTVERVFTPSTGLTAVDGGAGATYTLSVDQAFSPTWTGIHSFTHATSPIIVARIGPSGTQQHTLPAVVSDTVALLNAAQTLAAKTLTDPIIASFVNATHSHQDGAGGGALSAAAITSGTIPVARGGTGTGTAFTAGSVVFAGAAGVYSQDNASLFWDDTNNRLGIGTAAPAVPLHVVGEGRITTFLNVGATTVAAVSGEFAVGGDGTAYRMHYAVGALNLRDIFGVDTVKIEVNAGTTTRFNISNGNVDFAIHGLGAPGANFVYFDASVNRLGIGTSTPAVTLDVVGTIAASVAIVAPTIGPSGTQQHTLPAVASDTVALLNAAQTLAAKTLTTPIIADFTNATHNHQAAAGGGTLDHGLALTGLTDDDHTQYALLAGRAGGQTLIGGTAASENLTIRATSHATPGLVIVQSNGTPTEVARFGSIGGVNGLMLLGGATSFLGPNNQVEINRGSSNNAITSMIIVNAGGGASDAAVLSCYNSITTGAVSFGVSGGANTSLVNGVANEGFITSASGLVGLSLNAQGGTYVRCATDGVERWRVTSTGSFLVGTTANGPGLSLVQIAVAGAGANQALRIQAGAHTSTTAGAEVVDIEFLLDRTMQFNTSSFGTQRAILVRAPTYAGVGAMTITNASTMNITAAPVAGTNVTITNAWAFWIEAGRALFDGGLLVGAEPTGLAGKVGYTNTVDNTANSTGVGTILFKGTSSRDSSGFLRIMDGVTARFIPYFNAISG